MVSAFVSEFMNGAQDVVEQTLMPALGHERAQRAGGERRKIDRLQLAGDATAEERHQARGLGRRDRLRQQAQREAGEIGTALAVAQPVGDEGGEVDLAQLGIDWCCLEKMHLDELAELVGDAVLIGLDDRGMRDRQSHRPAEKRHHCVPIGKAADGGGFGEGRDEAEGRMQVRHHPGGDEHRKRARQHQRGQCLDPPQLGRARGVTGGVEREGGGGGHGGFRRIGIYR